MENELNRLRALKPKKPPTKQRKVDLWLNEIEQKQKEDGATIDEISQALFPELKPTTFRVMLRRARKKREKNSRPASPSASAGGPRKRGGSPPASPIDAQAPPSRKVSSAPASLGSGGGKVPKKMENAKSSVEHRETADKNGEKIEPQDTRIPPPWSKEPFDFSKLPIDMAWRDSMKNCRNWLEVHFFIKTIKANGVMGSPGGEMLARKFEKQFSNILEFE